MALVPTSRLLKEMQDVFWYCILFQSLTSGLLWKSFVPSCLTWHREVLCDVFLLILCIHTAPTLLMEYTHQFEMIPSSSNLYRSNSFDFFVGQGGFTEMDPDCCWGYLGIRKPALGLWVISYTHFLACALKKPYGPMISA